MANFEMTTACHLLGQFGGKKIITIAYEKEVVKAMHSILYQPHCTVTKSLQLPKVRSLIIPWG